MKRWWIGFLLALGACIPILANRSTGNDLLKDSDTAFLLMKLGERKNPWSWFLGDWPLENHFYRPVSTLVFEFDQWIHPNYGTGFGLTNAVLCCLCTLALFWLVTELRESWMMGALAAWLFTGWTLRQDLGLINLLGWALLGVCVVTLFIRPSNWLTLLGAFLAGSYVILEISGVAGVSSSRSLGQDTLHWIPGRTATTMTVFVLIALAAYVKFERLGANRLPASAPGPLDLPATRTTKVAATDAKPGWQSWCWLIVSLLATALALGSYEQAVMIPFLIFVIAFALRKERVEVRWWVQTGFWALLVGYIVLRTQIIPITPSGYQKQQFRSVVGSLFSLGDYIASPFLALPAAFDTVLMEWTMLFLTTSPFFAIKGVASNVMMWISMKRAWLWPLVGVLLSAISFAPMSLLHQFGHYHYLPMALRTVGVIAMVEGFLPALVSAVSLPNLQAPPRPDRAPGSLPHL